MDCKFISRSLLGVMKEWTQSFLLTLSYNLYLMKNVWCDKSVDTIFDVSALITYSMFGVYVNSTSCLGVMIAYDRSCQSARVIAISVVFENLTLLLCCLENNVLWYFGSRLSSILALESRHDLFSSLSSQDLMARCCLGCFGIKLGIVDCLATKVYSFPDHFYTKCSCQQSLCVLMQKVLIPDRQKCRLVAWQNGRSHRI